MPRIKGRTIVQVVPPVTSIRDFPPPPPKPERKPKPRERKDSPPMTEKERIRLDIARHPWGKIYRYANLGPRDLRLKLRWAECATGRR